MFRGTLLRLADEEHILLLTQHHIISDGWSIGVLVQEVRTLYSAFCQGQSDPLPPLALQYADYAQWQRGWLQGEALEQHLAFWKQHLGGAPSRAGTALPTAPAAAIRATPASSVQLAIPAALTAQLRALSQRHGATLFMTLLA
ncbi:condensation domain-containing protein [Massilia sp. B-10]|nr:condensation domain-containing protein [Massilia sp. B-10]